MATSRQTAHEKLVELLSAALIGDGLPVQTVEGSKVTALAGVSPLVNVLARGSNREPLTFAGDQGLFYFDIQVWVLQQLAGSWTYAQAEAALNAIEALIAGVCETNDRTANWELLEYDGPSTIVEIAVEGVPYYMERIPVQVVLGGS